MMNNLFKQIRATATYSDRSTVLSDTVPAKITLS
jgi:hypothetical protein